jgi:hypothetical protein
MVAHPHATKADAKNYGADILQMMAHAKKLEGHSITRSDAHGSINPLGVGSIVMSMFRRVRMASEWVVRALLRQCGVQAWGCPSFPSSPRRLLLWPSRSLTLCCISLSLPHYLAQGSTVPMQGAFGI